MNNQLSEMQIALLKTFKAFAEYCKENDITYYAGYGTLIGAIRHRGFIPWDDDMDVYMKRKDYDRFIACRDKLKDSSYAICDILDGDSPYAIGKFYSKEGTILEYKHFHFVLGPWIDVYPLDEGIKWCDKSDGLNEEISFLMWKYRKALSYTTFTEIFNQFVHFEILNACINLVKKFRYAPFKKIYLKRIERCIDRIRHQDGTYLQCYFGELNNEFHKKEWFDKAEIVSFEDTNIMIPQGYHEILSQWYGDYMKLPPLQQRKPGHEGYYTNLSCTLTYEEIMKECQNRPEASMSLKVIIDELKHRRGFKMK